MNKLLVLAALALLGSSCARAQNGNNNSGILYASDFNAWTLPQGNTPTSGMIQWTSAAICTVSSNGYSFVAVKVGRPLTIVDVNPSQIETVIPTAVNTVGGSCSVTAPMAYTHLSYHVQSGTAGLQEAIDFSAKLIGGSVVVLTPAWTVAGGQESMIAAAYGQSITSILDQTVANLCSYGWNGSSYAATGCGTNAASLTQTMPQNFAGPLNVPQGITAPITGTVAGNVIGSASLNVLKAGDTMTGALANSFGFNGPLNGNVGQTTPGLGTFTTFVAKSTNGALNEEVFPGSDVGARSNAAIAALSSGCGDVTIPMGAYTQSTAIQRPRCVNLHGQSALGTVLTWSGTTGAAIVAADTGSNTGYPEGQISDLTLTSSAAYAQTTCTTTVNSTAMTCASGSGIANGNYVFGPYIQPGTTVSSGGGTTSLTLSNVALATDATGIQPYAFSANNSIGIYVGGDPTGTLSSSGANGDFQNINRVRIFGFPTGLQFGNNAYSDVISQSLISNNRVGVAFPSWNSSPGPIGNSGEAISFVGTSIQNNTLGLNLIGFSDFVFDGSHCDYNTECGAVNAATFSGMHFEQGSGRILTVFGTSPPSVQIFGGALKLTTGTGTDTDMVYVNNGGSVVSTSSALRLSGTQVTASHTVNELVNWNDSTTGASLWIDNLPYHPTVTILTNSSCAFQGCNLMDATTGSVIINGANFKIDNSGDITALTLTTTQGGAGAKVGNTGGNGSVTGNAAGLELVSTTNGSPNMLFLTDSGVNLGTGTVSAPGIEPVSGTDCLQISSLGAITNTGSPCGTGGGGGTVTNVGMTVPSWLSVTGSPITSSGTLAVSANSQTQNLLLASPNGSSGSPSFRALVNGDLPGTGATTVNGQTCTLGGTCTVTSTSSAWPGHVYYIATAGADTNSGTFASPWLTPNHALNCGDTIIALPGTYTGSNFESGDWGTVTCSSGNAVAWLQCQTFDTCKISNAGILVSASYWGVQGWEVDASGTPGNLGACFGATPPTSGANIHHIIFANNVCSGGSVAPGGGFAGGVSAYANGTGSVDYVVIVGNIVYNAAGNNSQCFSGISVFQPKASDTNAGTHIYVAGNFSFGNQEPSPCAGVTAVGADGIIFDTFDGSKGLGTIYQQQAVMQNNILVDNGGRSWEYQTYTKGTPAHPTVFILNNTGWGNDTDTHMACSICTDGSLNIGYGVFISKNIHMTTTSTAGSGATTLSGMNVYDGSASNDALVGNLVYTASGTNIGSFNDDGNTAPSVSNNTTGTNPNFAGAANPAAPACSGKVSTVDCMSTVIANFTPAASAALGLGYQTVSNGNGADPLFPQWICRIGIPSGIISKNCN